MIDDAFRGNQDPRSPARVKAIADKFAKANRREQKPISANEVARLIRDTIPPDISQEDFERVVNRSLRPYDGPVLEPVRSPTARDIEREQRKKAMRARKKNRR